MLFVYGMCGYNVTCSDCAVFYYKITSLKVIYVTDIPGASTGCLVTDSVEVSNHIEIPSIRTIRL